MLRFTIAFLASVVLLAQQPRPETALGEAAADFAQGRIDEADQKLGSFLKDHPSDLRAVILKGAILDSRQRYLEANSWYQRALQLAPNSAQVLNNVGNHFLAAGNPSRARELYLKAIAIEPHHENANLQLAQMSMDDGQGGQVLVYLNKLTAPANSEPGVILLRARALALSGQCSDAARILGDLEVLPSAGATLFFSTGLVFAGCHLYEKAEQSFARALDTDPTNFEVLYNLGLAALEAGHLDRATSVLETTLKERPQDADCLYALSRAYLKQERLVDAAALLVKAQKLAPERAEVLLLLAQVSFLIEFYEDAAAAYSRYLKLKPSDDVARRERGMAWACANQPVSALADLEWYVRKHPRDAMGFYELAIAQYFADRSKASQALDRALVLDPAMPQAHYTRALLDIEAGKSQAAIDDLRFVLEHEPGNYRVLVRLGQAYLDTNRAADAAGVLKRALDLAPDQPLGLIYYHRALEKLGAKTEAAAVLSRLKHADSTAEGRRPQAGLIDYLSLSAAEQRARYLANLRKNSEANPLDARWTISLGKELLIDGDTVRAQEIFRSLKTTLSDPQLFSNCGKILLEFEQFELARQFLERALAADPSLSFARLDLATVLFHLQGPQAAILELDKTPDSDRRGDFYLLRAQLLDSLGKTQEAADALNLGIRAAPTRPGLYLQAAGFLLKHQLYHEALDLLEQASRVLADARDLLLAQAVTLYLLRRETDAQTLLTRIQARWPEWGRPYLLAGILLEIQLKSAEARQTLETAVALGANTPEAYYYQALAITHAAPDDLENAQSAIEHAMALTSKDPYVYLLAGKISLAKKDYSSAIQHLLEATKLEPALVPAHYALREAYKSMGDVQKSVSELDEIKRIARENSSDDQSPFSIVDFLFSVRPVH